MAVAAGIGRGALIDRGPTDRANRAAMIGPSTAVRGGRARDPRATGHRAAMPRGATSAHRAAMPRGATSAHRAAMPRGATSAHRAAMPRGATSAHRATPERTVRLSSARAMASARRDGHGPPRRLTGDRGVPAAVVTSARPTVAPAAVRATGVL